MKSGHLSDWSEKDSLCSQYIMSLDTLFVSSLKHLNFEEINESWRRIHTNESFSPNCFSFSFTPFVKPSERNRTFLICGSYSSVFRSIWVCEWMKEESICSTFHRYMNSCDSNIVRMWQPLENAPIQCILCLPKNILAQSSPVCDSSLMKFCTRSNSTDCVSFICWHRKTSLKIENVFQLTKKFLCKTKS